MWPFIRKQNNIIAISINPQYLTCCWLNKETKSNLININSYEKTEFKSLEFENALIFNPTKINLIINNFIKKNKITRPLISISISGPSVFEKIVTITKSDPTIEDFKLKDINNLQINYTYLCPAISENTNIGFIFYICGISQAQIFQYKLLKKKSSTSLALITTELASIIELYKYIKDQNFNQSQLAMDLSTNSYNIKTLFSPSIISKISKIKNNLNINLEQESQCLATSLGLFLLGDKTWKK
jgi:hypothetical protein